MEDISASQLRAARALLGLSQSDLAVAADVARATIADFEAGKREPYKRTLDDLRRALEFRGIEFIPENGRGVGVRLSARGKIAASLIAVAQSGASDALRHVEPQVDAYLVTVTDKTLERGILGRLVLDGAPDSPLAVDVANIIYGV